MITTVTARDTELPVSLDEAKSHLRVVNGDLDTHIQGLLEAATEYCETTTGRALRVSHTLVQKYCQWPCESVRFDRNPVLANQPNVTPTTAATTVQYYDANGTLQTVAAANYRVHVSSEAASYLEFDADFTRPTLEYRDDAVVITYMAGYASVGAVPKRAKPAILFTLELMFGNLDERQYANVEKARDALLANMDPGYYR